MTLQIILEALYCPSDAKVIEMIKQSTSVKSFQFNDKLFVIHSGFRFSTDNFKTFDLLIDLSDLNNPKLILIPVSSIASFPLILGLVVFKKQKYIDAYSKLIIAGISECNTKLYPMELDIDDIKKNQLSHSAFHIFRDQDNSIVESFPLSRVFTPKIVYDSSHFSMKNGKTEL
jgi:hypothetical protein